MARVVCQMLVRPDRLTFLWSEGPAAFEPYHKSGGNLHEFRELARRVHGLLRRLADTPAGDPQARADAGVALAQAGHELYQQLFRADEAQADLAQEVRTWLAGLDRQGAFQRLDVVSDAEEDLLPWEAVHDSPPDEHSLRAAAGTPEGWHGFWGARLELTTGRRVNPLRSRFLYEKPTGVLAVDPAAREALPADGWERLRAAAQAGGLTVVDSVPALLDALRAGRPDLLYLFCRVSGHTLLLGGERLTAAELREALREGAPKPGARSDPFVVLNACRAAGGEDDADVPDLAEALGTRAFVAPYVPAPPEFANHIGVEFLTGFLSRGERLGRLLHQLRGREAPLGLLYTAHAPAELRVVLGAEGGGTAIRAEGRGEGAGAPGEKADETPEGPEPLPLPETPYFPLTPYDAGDRALFLGREDDTEAFAEALDEPGLRVLVLHGAIGVGKASLLRAGAVPFLEEESVGFRALRDRTEPAEQAEGEELTEDDLPVAMIRASGDLAGQLAIALCDYCTRPYVYTTPAGRKVAVDLPGILRAAVLGARPATVTAIKEAETPAAPAGGPPPLFPDTVEPEAVRTALRRDLRLLGRLLADLAERLPHELVVFIEQGEELFTLTGGSDGATRVRGLEILRRVADVPGRARVVLSLRTEYQGRLLSQLQQGPEDLAWLRSYLLEPLSEKALVQAVLGPTAGQPMPGAAEAPFAKYRFLYEERLPEDIVRTARRAAADRRQSAAALVQAVCARAAALVRGRPDNVVRRADLVRIGNVEEGLVRDFEVRFNSLPLGGRERAQFRQLLDRLIFHTAEGLPVRDLVAEDTLGRDWKGGIALSAVLEVAAQARLVELNWLNINGKEGRYVSLGHDVLAPVMEREAEETTRRVQSRGRIADTLWIMIPLVILAVVWGWTRMRATWAAEAQLEKVEKAANQLFSDAKRHESEAVGSRWPVYAGFVSRAQDALRAGDLLTARQQLLGLLPLGRETQDAEYQWYRPGFEWYYLWNQLDRSRQTLAGHLAPVAAVAVAPDGKALASADEAGTIKLWDAGSGLIRATLTGHKGAVHALAFAPKGGVLASAGADGSVRLWDADTGAKGDYVPDAQALQTLAGHKGAVQALAFAPDGKALVSGGADGAVKLWHVSAKGKAKEGTTVGQWKGAVHALAWAPDGKTLAAGGSDDHLVQLWDVSKVGDGGKVVEGKALKGHGGPVRALAFSPDSKVLASGASERPDGFAAGSVRLWDVAAGKKLSALEGVPTGVFGLAFADGKTLAVAGKDDAVRLHDTETGRPARPLRGHLGWVRAVAFTPDGKTLVTGGQDAAVKLWDVAGTADRDVLRGHTGWVNAVAFAPDDKKLASAGADGLVKLWDVATGKEEHTLKGHKGAVLALVYSPDGKVLASAGADGTVRLWDVGPKAEKFGAELAVLKEHQGAVNALGFFENSKVLASGGEDGTARVWFADLGDKETFGKPMLKFQVLGPVRAVVLLADEKGEGHLAAAGDGRKILVWKLVGREGPASVLEGHTAAVHALAYWRESRRYLASAGADRTVRLWDVSKGLNAGTFRGHSNTVAALAFAQKGAPLLASGGWDGVVRLWNPPLRAERFTLTAGQGPLQSLAVSADQRTLASAGRDGTVRLWRGSPRAPGEK
jgi:WD40 repeat protein